MIAFAIVGQPKSGTSALADFLGQHPQICMSMPKEPTYFATDVFEESDAFYGSRKYWEFRTEAEYEVAFAHCRPGQLRGDASTLYLHSKVAASNLYAANPDLKVIMMLREPVSFMHSLHMQYVNQTLEDEIDSGRCVPPRVRCPSHVFYRERARYSNQLERYYAVFPRDNILAMTMEEFREDNEGHYRRVLELIGVDPEHVPSFAVVHPSTAPRSRRVNQVLNTPALKRALFKVLGPVRYGTVKRRVAGLVLREQPRAELPSALERVLRDEFGPEVDQVSRILGRDLRPIWGY
jgi:Sulfotransferase family